MKIFFENYSYKITTTIWKILIDSEHVNGNE